jgi:C4-dicarboxylate-specific signal transduction histidine kinase
MEYHMTPKFTRLRKISKLSPLIFATLLVLGATGCGVETAPPSPEARALKKDVSEIIQQMQQSLAALVVKQDIAGINAVLKNLSQKTACICINCPYKIAVLNKEGTLLTTFPKNEVVGRNFSSYKIISEPIQKQRITQAKAYLADGTKIYFISAPLLNDGKVAGVVVLALTPQDLEKKWQLTEKQFLNLNFNNPDHP